MESTEPDDSTGKHEGSKSRGGKGRGGKGSRKGGYGDDSVGVTREENGHGEGNDGGNDEDKARRGGKERGGKGSHGNKGGKRGRPAGAEDSVADGEDAEGARGGKDRSSKGGRGSKGCKSKGSHRAEQRDTPAGAASEAAVDNDQEDGRRGKNRGGKGDRGNKGYNNKGCGQAREYGSGGYNNEAPIILGDFISAAQPGVLPASGGPKYCLLCCQDAPSYVCLGPCGHAELCWVCAVRLRALSNDKCCPVCKVEAEEIVITDDASLPFPASSHLSSLPGDSTLGIRFASEKIERAVMRLFEYRCRLDQCAHSDVAFRSLWELENHLWKVHWRQFCGTCLKGRASFIGEQVVYTQRDMQRHCRWGDRASNTGGRDVPAVPAHSWCEFCKQYFRDDDDLLYHMHTCHHLCQICGGTQNQFYPNFRCLASHFAEQHYVCPHPDCAHDGHRLTVFSTPDELELHRLSAHTDKSQMTEKEKKATSNLRAFELTGFRSYADERATTSDSKGGGKGTKGRGAQQSSGFAVRFCYPKLADELGIERDEDEDAEPDTSYKRYQDRDVLPDPRDDITAVKENQTEQHEADEADGKEEGEDGDSETDEDDLNEELDKGLRDLPLQATVAKSGRQEGMLCCLDALQAVLQALLPGKPQLEEHDLQALKAVTTRLSLIEADTLERLRKDLASCSPSDCDWEPLERVLALRPFFFRLLRHAKGVDSHSRSIGPKSGDSKGSTGDSKETDWATWKYAAQLSVKALGHNEQHWLRAYIHFSLERRGAMSSGLGGVQRPDTSPSAEGQKKDVQVDMGLPDAAEFPTLGGDAEGSAIAEVAAVTWGRPKKQAPPSLLVQRVQPAKAARAPDSWDDDSPVAAASQELPSAAEENFPSLGGSGSSAARQPPAKTGWSAAGKAGQPAQGAATAKASIAAALTKAKVNAAAKVAKPRASVPEEASNFPSLGGSAKTSASPPSAEWGGAATAQAAKPKAAQVKPKSAAASSGVADFPTLGSKAAASSAPGWGAEARERAAAATKAKSEPPKDEAPKEFQVEENAFPDLPMGAEKPKKGAPKAGARTQQKAKAKSKEDAAAAIRASAQVPVEEPEEPPVELVPDDQLVVIHDPLEAVAKTEAMEAERRARKGKKPGGKTRLANPWMAGSSPVNAWKDK